MNRIGLAAMVLIAALVALAAVVAPAEENDGIRWEKDLGAARARAAESGRPPMVVFR